MDFYLLWDYGPALLSGFWVTLYCWLMGAALGLGLGFVVALLMRLPAPPLRWLLRTAIELLRGTPFALQLFLLYSGGPAVGIRLEPVAAGVIVLGVHSAAYFAEIFRAGFAAVPRGQVEAAVSLGMSPARILWRISLPVMLVSILPSLVVMLIVISKETVILSLITVPNLMFEVQTMASETYSAFAGILALTIFYWSFVELLSRLGDRVGRRVTAFLPQPAGAMS
jgi:polar amino acid transport system permease protein